MSLFGSLVFHASRPRIPVGLLHLSRSTCLIAYTDTLFAEHAQLQRGDPNTRRSYPTSASLIQLPIVAGYIPSIPWGIPFRVSIHSWDAPRFSQPLPETVPQDAVGLFEARVIVDGCCVACVLQHLRTHLWAYSALDSH